MCAKFFKKIVIKGLDKICVFNAQTHNLVHITLLKPLSIGYQCFAFFRCLKLLIKACMFYFSILDHVMLPMRTVSFKINLVLYTYIYVHMHA